MSDGVAAVTGRYTKGIEERDLAFGHVSVLPNIETAFAVAMTRMRMQMDEPWCLNPRVVNRHRDALLRAGKDLADAARIWNRLFKAALKEIDAGDTRPLSEEVAAEVASSIAARAGASRAKRNT